MLKWSGIRISTLEGDLYEAVLNCSLIKTIELTADIDAISSATYANRTVLVEGNGHTINGNNLSKTELRFAGSSNNLIFRNLNIKSMAGSLKYGGGAIGVYKGDLLVENCSFTGNSASGDGGAVLHDNTSGSLKIINSTFYNNQTTGNGGAVSSASAGEMINCTVINNSSAKAGGGGGVYSNTADQLEVYNSIVSGNLANGQSNDVS